MQLLGKTQCREIRVMRDDASAEAAVR